LRGRGVVSPSGGLGARLPIYTLLQQQHLQHSGSAASAICIDGDSEYEGSMA
jgi:hypothetical protein